MLDTNVVSALMRDPQGPIAGRIAALDEPASISLIVAAELRYGAERRRSVRLTSVLEQVLGVLEIEPLVPPLERVHARLRLWTEAAGRPMGANDLWIAAHALLLDRTLITRDAAFSRVAGLEVADWLEPDSA